MIFRKLCVLIFIALLNLLPLHADYEGSFSSLFFYRQPSSKAEAMGRGLVASADLDSYFYNPAGIYGIDFIECKFNTSSPLYFYEKARYYQAGFGYNLKNKLVISFNFNHFNYGYKSQTVTPEGLFIGEWTPYSSIYTVTMATSIFNKFLFGTNINYAAKNYQENSYKTFYFDIGAMYIHRFNTILTSNNILTIGASLINFTSSKINYSYVEEELPVISHLGISYSFIPNLSNKILNRELINIFLQAEYQYLLNYDYLNGFHIGIQTTLFNIIALRLGYYYENADDHNIAGNKDVIKEYTYGIGIETPKVKIFNFPITFKIDYTSLPQVSHVIDSDKLDNFNSITFKLLWNN